MKSGAGAVHTARSMESDEIDEIDEHRRASMCSSEITVSGRIAYALVAQR
jgi:hypothetical protein